MKATLDRKLWKQLLDIPDAEICAWITSDDQVWTITELRSLFGSTPPGMGVYVWQFTDPTHSLTQIHQQKRSFYHTGEIWKGIVYSDNVTFQGRPLWFDLAVLNQACAEDLLDYLKRGQFGMATGLLVESNEVTKEAIGTNISSAFLQAWNHQSTYDYPHEWRDETWQRIHRLVPGLIYSAQDMNCRRYFMTLSESAIPWLMSRSTGPLDAEALFWLGLDVGVPKASF
jgi:hypothetical protein